MEKHIHSVEPNQECKTAITTCIKYFQLNFIFCSIDNIFTITKGIYNTPVAKSYEKIIIIIWKMFPFTSGNIYFIQHSI